MNGKKRVSAGVLAIVAMGIGLVIFVATAVPASAGFALWCKDAFPGTCTQGGCDAQPGWYASECLLYCSSSRIVGCVTPPPQ